MGTVYDPSKLATRLYEVFQSDLRIASIVMSCAIG
jgi:hypothetical protein